MSIRHYKLVWSESKQKGSHKLTMLALAEMTHDKTDECFPSHQTLAEMVGVSTRQIRTILDELQNAGEIEILTGRGRNHTNVYKITLKEIGSGLPIIEEEIGSQEPILNEEIGSPLPILDAKIGSPARENRKPTSYKPILTNTTVNTSSSEGAAQLPTLVESSDHQLMFEKVCEIVCWDYKAIDEKCRGQVAQTIGILKKADYTLEDLKRFGRDVWAKDWRWEKHKQHPTLAQLRQEIGKLRAKAFSANGSPGATTWAKAFAEDDTPEYIKHMQAGK